MSGRILRCSACVCLLVANSGLLKNSSVLADEPPAESKPAVLDQNQPLELAGDLFQIRRRNHELLALTQSKRISIEFRNAPLSDVVVSLSELSGIPMQLDVIALEEVGIPVDVECSIRAKDARVSSVLSRILDRLELAWTIENESLQITSEEAIADSVHTMVFAAGDIVKWFQENNRGDERRDRFGFAENSVINGVQTNGLLSGDKPGDLLKELLQEHCGGQWEEIDGVGGTVSFAGGLLTVRQSLPILLQVDSFLKRLRSIQKSKPSENVWAIPEGGFGWPENSKAMSALRKPITVKFSDTPMSDAVSYLAQKLEVQIDIDMDALDEIGILDDEPLNLTMSGTASAVLGQLLKSVQLTWIVHDDTLQITSWETSQEHLFAVVADTRGLFATGRFTEDQLTEMIQVETNGFWVDLDGDGGTIQTAGGLTFIRQTQATIAEVAVLLKDLRARAALADSTNAPGEAEGMDTRFYKAESEDEVDSLMTALTNFVFPDTWETNGGDGVMVKVGSRVVVRQTADVHKAISEFLRELRTAE